MELRILQPSYTLEEGGSQDVCVALIGQLERNISATLSTVEGTARGQLTARHELLVIFVPFLAGMDYNNVSMELVFAPNAAQSQVQCATITASSDSLLEDSETLVAVLTSSDQAVLITRDTSQVTIVDTNSES